MGPEAIASICVSVVAVVGVIFAAGKTVGIVKTTIDAKMLTFITHDEHKSICHEQYRETQTEIHIMSEKLDEVVEGVAGIRGYLKGKYGEAV